MIENGVCTCKDCTEKRENQKRHMNSPFYQEVRSYTELIEVEQILKGAEKYPEPFNPDSWSNDQLSNHAMQEMRDGQVYITGMRDRMRKQEKEIARLKAEVARWEDWHNTVKNEIRATGIIVDERV